MTKTDNRHSANYTSELRDRNGIFMDLDFNEDGEGKIREYMIIHQWNSGKKPLKLDYGNTYRTRIFLEMD